MNPDTHNFLLTIAAIAVIIFFALAVLIWLSVRTADDIEQALDAAERELLRGGDRREMVDKLPALLAPVFGAALDPARVRLRRRKWFPFQPQGTVMAPCGHLHFHPDSGVYRNDFSRESASLQAFFEKASQADPFPGRFRLRLAVETVIDPKRGLHDSNLSDERFLSILLGGLAVFRSRPDELEQLGIVEPALVQGLEHSLGKRRADDPVLR